MVKNCRICGKEFETPNSRYCTCSPECSIKNRSIMQKKYHFAHPKYHQRDMDRQREKFRQRFCPCRICGENVPSVSTAKDKAVLRAWNTYAYTVKELKEMLKNE